MKRPCGEATDHLITTTQPLKQAARMDYRTTHKDSAVKVSGDLEILDNVSNPILFCDPNLTLPIKLLFAQDLTSAPSF